MPHKKIILFSKVNKWLLYDDFSDERAVGTISGTYPKVGSRRVVNDTQGAMSLGSGKLITKLYTGTTGDPSIWWGGFSRVPGRMYVFKDFIHNSSGSSRLIDMGVDNNQLTASHTYLRLDTALLYCVEYGILSPTVGSYTPGNPYNGCLVDKGAQKGTFFFLKGNPEYPNWTLLWNGYGTGTSAYSTLYPNSQFRGSGTLSSVRVPKETWIPSPIATDTFNRASGTLEFTESLGIERQSAPVKPWVVALSSGSAWTADNGMAYSNPINYFERIQIQEVREFEIQSGWIETAGAIVSIETGTVHGGTYSRKLSTSGSASSWQTYLNSGVLNIGIGNWVRGAGWLYIVTGTAAIADAGGNVGNMASPTQVSTRGQWVYCVNTSRMVSGTGSKPSIRMNNSGSVAYGDDYSTELIQKNSLFTTFPASFQDFEMSVNFTLPDIAYGNTQAGLVFNLDNPDDPQNFYIVYYESNSDATGNGGRMRFERCVGGTYSPVSIYTSAIYAPNSRLRVVRNGNGFRFFYKEALILVATQSPALSGTYFGMFSTYEKNQFKNFNIHALGTEGQYRYLDNFIK